MSVSLVSFPSAFGEIDGVFTINTKGKREGVIAPLQGVDRYGIIVN